MKIAAWNVQRGSRLEAIANLLYGVDIALLCECDIGMARSGNVDTAQVIADRLGMFKLFAAEFHELGLGNLAEQKMFAGRSNGSGLHGNAILSKHKIQDADVIRLDDGAVWRASEQPRMGARIGLVAKIKGITFVSTHFESRAVPAVRGEQMRRLVAKLSGPCVIGGDFNTKTAQETLFEEAKTAGFSWEEENKDGGRWKGKRLDWLFCRGVQSRNPQIHDASGISDHDLITLEVECAS